MLDNDIAEIEQELPDVEEETAEAEKPSEPLSLRDQLKDAAKSAQEDKPENNNTESKTRERAPDGKFAKKAAADGSNAGVVVDKPVVAVEKIAPPESYSAAVKAKWETLAPDIQRELQRREQDFHKELTKHDDERVLGRSFEKLVTPYVAQMRAEGAQPLQAVEALLNTAHVLRTGSPEQKTRLLLETARQFGVNLSQAQQAQAQVHPVLQQLQDRQAQLERQLQQEKALKTQQEQDGLQSQIAAFAADPKNVHFEKVKPVMAALLQGGTAKDLPDAYDRAVYADPEIRSTILSQQSADLEAKRVADKKAKAEAAKRAGSSIRGAPGMVANKNGAVVHSNLRDELKANLRAQLDS